MPFVSCDLTKKTSLGFSTVMLNFFKSHFLAFTFTNFLLNMGKSSVSADFHIDTSWPDFTVSSLQVYGSAIAVDYQSNVVILHRSTSMRRQNSNISANKDDIILEDVILILASTSGKILASWGAGKFVKPHGLEISGKDIFITDVRLHQVLKFIHDKESGLWFEKPALVLGERFVSGDDQRHFCSPADVAVMPGTKDFFVADGYCNSRVVKFNEFGSYLGEFRASSWNPLLPAIPFNVTHAVIIAAPCQSTLDLPTLVFVADRNNGRVHCLTENGTFLYEIGYENFSSSQEMLLSLAINGNGGKCFRNESYGRLYAVNGHLPLGQPKIFEMTVSDKEFKMISSFAVSQNENNVKLSNLRVETPHDITLSEGGNELYLIEAYGNLTVKKFVKNSTSSFYRNDYFSVVYFCIVLQAAMSCVV